MCVNGRSNSLCRCILAFWHELGEGGSAIVRYGSLADVTAAMELVRLVP